jgi:hypothetical protein
MLEELIFEIIDSLELSDQLLINKSFKYKILTTYTTSNIKFSLLTLHQI